MPKVGKTTYRASRKMKPSDPDESPRMVLFSRVLRLVGVAALASSIQCSDTAPTQPRLQDGSANVDTPRGEFVRPAAPLDLTAMPSDAADEISHTISVGQGGVAGTQPVTIYQAPTGDLLVYDATASGTLSGQWTVPQASGYIAPIPPGGVGTISCSGYLVAASGSNAVADGIGFECNQANPATKRVSFRDSLRVGRAAGPVPTSQYENGVELCHGYDCVDYSGSHVLTLSRVQGQLSGGAYKPNDPGTPITETRFGLDVATKTWPTYQGAPTNALAYRILDWQWVADPTSLTPRFAGCWWYGTQCTYTAYRSGAIEVTGYVNGKKLTKQVHIRVVRRKLQLSPKFLLVPKGSRVTFAAARDTAGGTATAPVWAISDTGAATQSTCTTGAWTCAETAVKDYDRTVSSAIDDSLQSQGVRIQVYTSLEIRPDNPTPRVGDTVTYRAYADNKPTTLGSWLWRGADTVVMQGCDSTCKRVMDAPGSPVMWGWAGMSSGGDSVSASVQVRERYRLHLRAASSLGTAAEGGSLPAFEGEQVEYSLTSDNDAPLTGVRWSVGGSTAARRSPGPAITMLAAGFTATTCDEGVVECSDRVGATYNRLVTATVDDVQQSVGVTINVYANSDVGDSSSVDSPSGSSPNLEPAPASVESDTSEFALCLYARVGSSNCRKPTATEAIQLQVATADLRMGATWCTVVRNWLEYLGRGHTYVTDLEVSWWGEAEGPDHYHPANLPSGAKRSAPQDPST